MTEFNNKYHIKLNELFSLIQDHNEVMDLSLNEIKRYLIHLIRINQLQLYSDTAEDYFLARYDLQEVFNSILKFPALPDGKKLWNQRIIFINKLKGEDHSTLELE